MDKLNSDEKIEEIKKLLKKSLDFKENQAGGGQRGGMNLPKMLFSTLLLTSAIPGINASSSAGQIVNHTHNQTMSEYVPVDLSTVSSQDAVVEHNASSTTLQERRPAVAEAKMGNQVGPSDEQMQASTNVNGFTPWTRTMPTNKAVYYLPKPPPTRLTPGDVSGDGLSFSGTIVLLYCYIMTSSSRRRYVVFEYSEMDKKNK